MVTLIRKFFLPFPTCWLSKGTFLRVEGLSTLQLWVCLCPEWPVLSRLSGLGVNTTLYKWVFCKILYLHNFGNVKILLLKLYSLQLRKNDRIFYSEFGIMWPFLLVANEGLGIDATEVGGGDFTASQFFPWTTCPSIKTVPELLDTFLTIPPSPKIIVPVFPSINSTVQFGPKWISLQFPRIFSTCPPLETKIVPVLSKRREIFDPVPTLMVPLFALILSNVTAFSTSISPKLLKQSVTEEPAPILIFPMLFRTSEIVEAPSCSREHLD